MTSFPEISGLWNFLLHMACEIYSNVLACDAAPSSCCLMEVVSFCEPFVLSECVKISQHILAHCIIQAFKNRLDPDLL